MVRDKERLGRIKRLTLFLFIVFLVKDVLVPGIFYILHFSSEEVINSYESAMVQYICLIGASLLYLGIWSKEEKREEGQKILFTPRRLAWISLLAVTSFVSLQALKKAFLAISFLVTKDMGIIEYVRPCNTSTLVLLFIVYVIWSAIAEELLYRGVIYRELSDYSRLTASLITSLYLLRYFVG